MIGSRSTEKVVHIYSQDPALDRDAESFADAWAEFLKTGDKSKLPIRDGHTPTLWHIQRLKRKRFLWVLDQPDSHRASEAIAFGLKQVDGFTVDGVPFALGFKKFSDSEDRLSEDTLEILFDPTFFGELGVRILGLSKLPPT